jgi:hypothetical protein
MQRTVHKSIAVLLVVLYLPMALLGTAGLHELSGCHHEESACCVQNGHGTTDASISVRSGHDAASHSADDCSICQWYAQGQQLSAIGLGICDLPLVQSAALPETPTDLPRLSGYERLPRAPPLFF